MLHNIIKIIPKGCKHSVLLVPVSRHITDEYVDMLRLMNDMVDDVKIFDEHTNKEIDLDLDRFEKHIMSLVYMAGRHGGNHNSIKSAIRDLCENVLYDSINVPLYGDVCFEHFMNIDALEYALNVKTNSTMISDDYKNKLIEDINYYRRNGKIKIDTDAKSKELLEMVNSTTMNTIVYIHSDIIDNYNSGECSIIDVIKDDVAIMDKNFYLNKDSLRAHHHKGGMYIINNIFINATNTSNDKHVVCYTNLKGTFTRELHEFLNKFDVKDTSGSKLDYMMSKENHKGVITYNHNFVQHDTSEIVKTFKNIN